MIEQWLPLGPIGIITAFNFPVAVWAWNTMIAAVCGDTMIWKPSPLAPLCSIAVQKIVEEVARVNDCEGVFNLCSGGPADIGETMIADTRLPLISATGSCRMGRRVGEVVGRRLGRAILELGGNNAIIITPERRSRAGHPRDGFRGRRHRRPALHVGTPLDRAPLDQRPGDRPPGSRLSPRADRRAMGSKAFSWARLSAKSAVTNMMAAVDAARKQGGQIVYGGKRLDRAGFFVEPTLVKANPGMAIVAEETFAPILYVMSYRTLDEAVAIQNAVEQGLTSAIFTNDLREAEEFLSPSGSDCGIANVNIGTSGAEIGGAFGGEKATGGGREAGSDAWKAYMRRQTCTINYGRELPLAQGVRFDI